MIAALYVDPVGTYADLEGVDCWGEGRDARLYPGPHPVVAHPPCARWSTLAAIVEAAGGKRRGDDGGCFAAALAAVRRWGGVLEHPENSGAWPVFGLPRPPRSGGWVRGFCGGWSCYVEQGRYGHPARKGTWIYAHGADLPTMLWGHGFSAGSVVSRFRRTEDEARRREMKKTERAATPPAFRDILIEIARSARP